MPAPFTVVGASGLPVFVVDLHGNVTQLGTLTSAGGLVLQQSAAPAPAPGSVAMYSPDGKSIATIGPDGASVPTTISGNATIGGTLTVAGASGFSAPVTITTAANGALVIVGSTVGQQLIEITAADTTTLGYESRVTGDGANRFQIGTDGTINWGDGTDAVDTDLYRSAAGILKTDDTFEAAQHVRAAKNLGVGGFSSLGDNGVGEIQITDVTTVPTTNPTGGTDVYSQSATSTPLKARDTGGRVRSLADAFAHSGTDQGPVTVTAQTASTALNLAVEASATYLMEAMIIMATNVASGASLASSWTGPAGATMQWADTNTTADYASTLGAVLSGDVGADGNTHAVFYKGQLATSTTAGTLTYTFAVSTTTNSPSMTQKAGSWIRLTRVL